MEGTTTVGLDLWIWERHHTLGLTMSCPGHFSLSSPISFRRSFSLLDRVKLMHVAPKQRCAA